MSAMELSRHKIGHTGRGRRFPQVRARIRATGRKELVMVWLILLLVIMVAVIVGFIYHYYTEIYADAERYGE